MSTPRKPPPGAFGHPGFAAVADALSRFAGLKVPPHRFPEIERAAEQAMRRAGLSDPAEYAARLVAGELPLADLVSAFTVGETYFFRDPAQLELLVSRVVPELTGRRPPGHVLRAWSAGCASGEEAYTIALVLERAGVVDRFSVLGTDVSRPALARARVGRYGEWSLRGAARETTLRALEHRGDRWEVPARIRARVRFEYLNLAEDVYPSVLTATAGLDLVLCRNVFIYFEPDVVAAVAERFFRCLAEGGWLFTGLADPPLRQYAPFEAISTEAGVVYRKPARGEDPRASPPWPPSFVQEARPTIAAPSLAPPPAPPLEVGPDAAPADRGPIAPAADDAPDAHPDAPAASPDPTADALDAALAASRAGAWREVVALAEPLLATPAGAAVLVRAAANAGALGVAEPLSARATERHPLAPELHLLRGAVLTEIGRDDEALEAIRRCLYLDRTLAVAHAALAGLLARRDDVDGARRAWRNVRRLCEAEPPDAPLPLGEGRCAGRLSAIASAQLSILGGDVEP